MNRRGFIGAATASLLALLGIKENPWVPRCGDRVRIVSHPHPLVMKKLIGIGGVIDEPIDTPSPEEARESSSDGVDLYVRDQQLYHVSVNGQLVECYAFNLQRVDRAR